MTSNSDYSADFLDDELEDEVDKMSRIPSVTMNRLIRRDVAGGNTKLLADVDVAAPSVNVQDLPESEVGNPTGNRKFHVPTNASNDVCFTRTNLILSLLILAALGIVTISLMYLVISRVTENESASRKTKKLPLPDFSR